MFIADTELILNIFMNLQYTILQTYRHTLSQDSIIDYKRKLRVWHR